MQIIEEKEASLRQRQIQICSSGVYLANKEFLFELLAKVKPNNLKKEYYLTDIVQEAARLKKHAKAYVANNPQSFLGINDLAELSQVEEILLKRIKTAHMKNGVRLIMPETIYIEPSVKIAEDCVIEPHVCLFGKTQISSGKRIKAFSCLKDQKV